MSPDGKHATKRTDPVHAHELAERDIDDRGWDA
jgi:hypothetical protein